MQFYSSPSEQVKETFNKHLEEEGKPDRDPAESLPGRRKGWAQGQGGLVLKDSEGSKGSPEECHSLLTLSQRTILVALLRNDRGAAEVRGPRR